MRTRRFAASGCLLGLFLGSSAASAANTTAWSNGTFNVDTPNVVARSNIIIGQANVQATDSMPDVSAAAAAGTPTLHVFSLAVH